jgi:hypothetical protein
LFQKQRSDLPIDRFYEVVTVNEEPVAGATIRIKDSAGKTIGTVETDENGYYFYYYKYNGKEATFTVTLTSAATGTRSQKVTLKSNKFVWTPFKLQLSQLFFRIPTKLSL